MAKNNETPVVESKSQYALVRGIVNFFRLGDEGKIESFFEKQRKVMKREIAKLETAASVRKLAHDNSVEDLEERLEDAKEAAVTAYSAVNPAKVATNAMQADFGPDYWAKIELCEATVKTLEEQIADFKDSYKNELKAINDQIAERKRRMVKISEK